MINVYVLCRVQCSAENYECWTPAGRTDIPVSRSILSWLFALSSVQI